MEELIKQVSTRAGISEDQARSAVTTVLEFVKGKLPDPIASQIESAIGSSGGSVSKAAGDIASKVGGLLG
jgi:hypothetical protein